MNLSWAAIVGIVATLIIVSVVVLALGEIINKGLNFDSADKIILVAINAATAGGAILIPHYRWVADKGEKRLIEQKENLETHKRDIVEKFERARGLNSYVYGLLESLDTFSYKKELLEHLYTGHKSVFSLIGQATTDERQRFDANLECYETAKRLVAEEASKLSITYAGSSHGPPYYTDSAHQHVIAHVATGKGSFFVDVEGSRYVVVRTSDGNKTTCAAFRAQDQAEVFASRLNKLGESPELSQKLKVKQEWVAKKELSTAEALEAFRNLLNAVESKALNLEGACRGCADMSGRNDNERMIEELREFDKIEWVKEKLRR